MFFRRLVQLISLSLLWTASVCAEENVWPLFVIRNDQAGTAESAQYVGPLFFHRTDGIQDVRGFRPLFLTTRTGDKVEKNIIYPLFTWKSQPGYSSFSFLHLIERQSAKDDTAPPNDRFDIWPAISSRVPSRCTKTTPGPLSRSR